MQLFRRLNLLVSELQKLPATISDLTRVIRDQSRSSYEAEEQRRAFENHQVKIQCSGVWASWAAVLAASVYAAITAFQFKEMRRQTDANFNGQAGWLEVLIENVKFTEVDIAGHRAAHTQLWIRNRGLSPLTQVDTSLVIRTFSIDTVPKFIFEGPKTCQEVGIIYPGHSNSEEPELAGANNAPTLVWLNDDPNSTKLPDCEDATTLVLQPPKPISALEYQQLIDGDKVIVAYAKISYSDIYKRRHTEFMCRVLPPAQDIGPRAYAVLDSVPAIPLRRACLRYNNIDPKKLTAD